MKRLLLILLIGISTSSVFGQVDALIGEVRMFAGNFAPKGWMFCEGQLMSISSNPALFSVLGTQYGGNGVQTFELPDLRGRVPVGVGQPIGQNVSINQGEYLGTSTVTINNSNLPIGVSNVQVPKPSQGESTINVYGPATPTNVPIPIYPPSMGIRFIICVEGIYPSRN